MCVFFITDISSDTRFFCYKISKFDNKTSDFFQYSFFFCLLFTEKRSSPQELKHLSVRRKIHFISEMCPNCQFEVQAVVFGVENRSTYCRCWGGVSVAKNMASENKRQRKILTKPNNQFYRMGTSNPLWTIIFTKHEVVNPVRTIIFKFFYEQSVLYKR